LKFLLFPTATFGGKFFFTACMFCIESIYEKEGIVAAFKAVHKAIHELDWKKDENFRGLDNYIRGLDNYIRAIQEFVALNERNEEITFSQTEVEKLNKLSSEVIATMDSVARFGKYWHYLHLHV